MSRRTLVAETGCAQTRLHTRQHMASLGCTGHCRRCRAGRQKQKYKQPLGIPVVVGRRPVNSKCVNRGNASAYISYSQNTSEY